jgi:hypothetical protein
MRKPTCDKCTRPATERDPDSGEYLCEVCPPTPVEYTIPKWNLTKQKVSDEFHGGRGWFAGAPLTDYRPGHHSIETTDGWIATLKVSEADTYWLDWHEAEA